MIVCLCEGVSERRVRRVIGRGAGTIEEVGAACKAGVTCLSCHPVIEDLIEEAAPVRVRMRANVA